MNVKNILTVIIALSLCFVSTVSPVYSVNSTEDEGITYKVYNEVTGEEIEEYGYTLKYATDYAPTSRSIIGSGDSRQVDPEKNGVVKLMSGNTFVGTGFVVDDYVIATAAHCVYDCNITSIRLFDGNGNLELTVVPEYSHIPSNYVNGANSTQISYDYALISVSTNLSNYAMFNIGLPLDTAINNEIAVSVTGFPGEYNSNTQNNIYTGTGNLVSQSTFTEYGCTYDTDYKLFYDVDTSGGNSGGPVYVTTLYNGELYYTVIGIHTHGVHNSTCLQLNKGTKMTTEVVKFYVNNPNI